MTQTTRVNPIPQLTLVKAGAGAGKTYKIQETLADWVLNNGLKPESILAVTFTNAAAAEMRERIRARIIEGAPESKLDLDLTAIDKATISTIHGFGLDLIERFAYEKGLNPKPRQLTEAEENLLVRQALSNLDVVIELAERLDEFGYTAGHDQSRSDVFRQTVLNALNKTRSLGKGFDAKEAQYLIAQAQENLQVIYGENLGKAETLNSNLWSAIEDFKAYLPTEELAIEADFDKNASMRAFRSLIYKADTHLIATDFKAWVTLQSAGTLTRVKDEQLFSLAEQIELAASKLTSHPYLYELTKEHLTKLLEAASQALASYQDGKTKAGLVDFSDMIHLANLIMEDPECFNEALQDYGCLVIDEFQDTNPLQFALLRHFQKAGLPTFIVGDLKQSIMGFQGADSRLFATLLNNACSGEATELDKNWRSTKAVMDFVNQVGVALYASDYQSLEPSAGHKDNSELTAVRKLTFKSDNWISQANARSTKAVYTREGYELLVEEIYSTVQSGKQITDKSTDDKRPISYKDIAVLAPTKTILTSFARALRQANIPTRIAQDGFKKSPVTQLLLSALQYLNNDTDYYAALMAICNDLVGADMNEQLALFMEDGFNHPYLDKLDELRGNDYGAVLDNPVEAQLLLLLELLEFDQLIEGLVEGEQYRANMIKLLGMAQEFDELQDASLQAMGIYGRNSNTFRLWLNKTLEDNNSQPEADDLADAVTLATWHASKGLEWPVVMVLGSNTERLPNLPDISISYPSPDIDRMLEEGFIQILPNIVEPSLKEKFTASLLDDAVITQKNLVYVALTRAREQLIIPWLEAKSYKDNSMQGYLASLFENGSGFEFEDNNMVYAPIGIADQDKTQTLTRNTLVLNKQEFTPSLNAVTSPSGIEEGATADYQVESHQYSEKLDLSSLDTMGIPANEIGTWMHRLYQVHLKQPNLIDKALAMLPTDQVGVVEPIKDKVLANLYDFKSWMETNWQPINYQCELSILAINEHGQTVSGSVDLLVETADGYWIIDHKTDKQMGFKKHYAQLKAYDNSLNLDKPVKGIAINWVREGVLEIVDNEK